MLSFLHDTQHHATLRCTVLYCITTPLLILSLSNTLDSPSYTVSLLLSLPTSHLPLSSLSSLPLSVPLPPSHPLLLSFLLSFLSLSPSSLPLHLSLPLILPLSLPLPLPLILPLPLTFFSSSSSFPTYFSISILPYLTLLPLLSP